MLGMTLRCRLLSVGSLLRKISLESQFINLFLVLKSLSLFTYNILFGSGVQVYNSPVLYSTKRSPQHIPSPGSITQPVNLNVNLLEVLVRAS